MYKFIVIGGKKLIGYLVNMKYFQVFKIIIPISANV